LESYSNAIANVCTLFFGFFFQWDWFASDPNANANANANACRLFLGSAFI